MKTYEQYKINAAIELNVELEQHPPAVRQTYRALDKDGNVHDSDNVSDIMKIDGFRYKTIKNKEDQEKFDAFWALRRKVEQAACAEMTKDLRQEYSQLNDATYDMCYSEAYERGHSSGYDEVVSCMRSIVEFAEKIININK